MSERACRYCDCPIGDEDWSGCCSLQCEEAQEDAGIVNGLRARLAAAESDVSHARHVIHGTGQLGASLGEEAELVAAALAQTRKMLSTAEAELAELKQRIAEAPVARGTRYADGTLHHAEKWNPRVGSGCLYATAYRLLEVRDVE